MASRVESSEIESPFTWRLECFHLARFCHGEALRMPRSSSASFMALGSHISLNCEAPLPRLLVVATFQSVTSVRGVLALLAHRGLGCYYYYYYYYYSYYYFHFPFSRALLLRLNFVVVLYRSCWHSVFFVPASFFIFQPAA